MKLYVDKKYRFYELFNPQTGFYYRSGVIEPNSRKDTGVDSFMRSMPSLIDIGIMGHCKHGSSGLCIKAGVECYQNGLGVKKENMNLENYKSIISQVIGKVQQVALGGRGDVNKHEEFGGILKHTLDNRIVPNYTTSGLELTQEEVDITKKYCGAVAVSWYRQEHTLRALDMFIKSGIRTNIHYVLGNNSIDEAISRVKEKNFPEGINAIIFLLHKPVGLGSNKNMLNVNNPKVKEFFEIVEKGDYPFKVGFDSCSIPGLLNFTSNIESKYMDTCEGARFSCYISADMQMVPCSFDQSLKWAVDLKKHTVEEAWNSAQFEDFRSSLKNSCPNCPQRNDCMGGCPIVSEIVLCNKIEKAR